MISKAKAVDEDVAAGGGRDSAWTGRRHRGGIALKIGTAILSGTYKPGDTLFGEIEASQELGVSRAAYREAVRTLAAKGLVESRPKLGTKILPRSRWSILDPEVLAWAFSGNPDVDLVRDLFELRTLIEPGAARFAAERRTRDDINQLRTSLSAMKRHTLATEEGRQADRDFHSAILKATHNSALTALGASVGAAVSWTTAFKQRSRKLPRDPIPDHATVADAIIRGQGTDAEIAMHKLVQLAYEDSQLNGNNGISNSEK